MPHKSTENSDFDTVDAPEMVVNHRRKRSASPSLPHRPRIDASRTAKKSKTTVKHDRRTRTASSSFAHRPPIDSNRSAEKSNTAHHIDGIIPVWIREASASMPKNGSSPIPSLLPVDSGSTEKTQQTHTTAKLGRRMSASPSLPHRPPIDCNRSAKKWRSNYYSGDTIWISTGEGEARTHNNDPSPVPSPPPVDSRSAGRNQQAQTEILPISISISTRAGNPHKRKLEVLIDLPHKPKPAPDLPAAKRRSLTLVKKIQSKFPRPKSVCQSVSVGWNFGGPPS